MKWTIEGYRTKRNVHSFNNNSHVTHSCCFLYDDVKETTIEK